MQNCFVGILAALIKPFDRYHLNIEIKKNNFLFYICILISTLLLILYSTPGNLGYLSYSDLLSTKSPIVEYSLIFFAIAVLNSESKAEKIILLSFVLIYIYLSTARGGRIEAIQILLLIFCISTWLQERVTWKTIIFCSIISFFALEVIAVLRLAVNSDISSAFKDVYQNRFTQQQYSHLEISHHGDVIYASMRLIAMKDLGFFSFIESFIAGISYWFSLLIPKNLAPIALSLASYKSNYFPTGGGGSIYAYFYVWYGYLGVLFIPWLLAFLINNTTESKNLYLKFYTILLLATCPRWYAYTPLAIVKFCIIGAILFYFINSVFKVKRVVF